MKRLCLFFIAGIVLIFAAGCGPSDNSSETNDDHHDKSEADSDESIGQDSHDIKDNHSQKKNSDTQDDEQGKPQKTVNVSVITGDVQGTVLSETAVEVKEGDTAMDVTRRILKEKGIQYSVRGSKNTAYMEGIANLYEQDKGPLSGWHVRVNGKMIERSAGAVSVKAGDTVNWDFTTSYLEDTGN